MRGYEAILMTHGMVVTEETLSTRQKATQLVRDAHSQGYETLDLSNVEFMTRSVADELRYYADNGEIELSGLQGEAKELFDLVSEQSATA